jgi:Big-like domain-containing protein
VIPSPTTTHKRLQSLLLIAGALAATMVRCGGKDGVGPGGGVSSVHVTSAVDNILVPSRTSQLTAKARDQGGNEVAGAPFTWESSSPTVVTISSTGLATALAIGTTTITATTPGRVGPVKGTIELRVVQADLATVSAVAGDAFGGVLLAALSSAKRPAVQAAWDKCGAGASTGNIAAVKSCVDGVRAEAASATDPTDQVLSAVLVLYVDQIERRLGL